ncbi:hypothetical protein HQN87_25870 [Paenibacillus tritici]|jgi:hypothetical protein|uniref:ABC transporter permease n=1 Tax=Paenibacillus tritici TaxID=1873425 RepID=A0ABX2DXP2_9BACL|nr:hypothetical protein [Paenibacillus tritici]NQX48753.1 hypothetical protein [Paenibacillus tritici]QUL55504.1 hypothetical protein KDC22_02685 [Paenibacillus tritici]
MTTLKHAWVIVRSEFHGDRLKLLWALLFSMVFMGYFSAITGMVIDDTLTGSTVRMLSDVLMITMILMLSISFSRRTMKYLSEDSYTRMLAYMRALPVPVEVILCKRKLNALFAIALNGTLYFSLIYWLSPGIRSELPVPAYLAFTFTWVGFSLLVSGLYIVIEFSVSGKAYFWSMAIIMILAIGATGLVYLAGGNMMLASAAVSKEWGLGSPLMWGALVLGLVSLQLFSKWTIHRLKSRDLV